MSLPPHVYPCVLQRLPTSVETPASYRSGCLLFDQKQFDSAHASFTNALTQLADSLKVQLPAISEKPAEEHKERDRGQSTTLAAPSSSRPRALSNDDAYSDDSADDPTSPLPPNSPQPPSSPPTHRASLGSRSPSPAASAAAPSGPRVQIDDTLSNPPTTRPISHSHTPTDYSHIQPAARSLLAHVHNAVACCCIHLRLYRSAKQHLYRAIDLLPDHATLLYNLATAHHTHRHYDTAAKAYRMAIKRDGGNAAYHSNLAAALLAAKEYNKALAEMAKVVEMAGEGSSVAYGNLACGCMGKRKWKEAISYLRKAISIEHRTLTLLPPLSADHAQSMVAKALLHAQLAYCLLQNGGEGEAVLWQATMALSLCPRLPHARRCRALVWAGEERWLMAVVEAQQAVREWLEAVEGEDGWEWRGWRRDRYVDEVQRSIDEWKAKLPTDTSGADEEKRPQLITAQQHQLHIDDLHTTYKQQIKPLQQQLAQLQLTHTPPPTSHQPYTAHDSTPPTPRTLQKQEKIVCVVCMDEVRSVLFEPCKHLLCCEQCGSLVRACPFCKQAIKKRRGPIFM